MPYRRRTLKPTRPTRVAEVLQGYLRSAGIADRVGQATVVEEWPERVGPRIARATQAESVALDGTLFVRVPSSAWRQELSLMAPEILELVNRGRASGRIARIRWLVGTDQVEDAKTPRRQGEQDAKTPRREDAKATGRQDAKDKGAGRRWQGRAR